jgi:aerobic-type carbon monoxide dehydrogenase small subunit (CoxS/CutS family)
MPVNLTVNGTALAVEASPDALLLYVLRNNLRLNGAKYGCGIAACGACTVLADGAPVRACVTALRAVEGKKIETVEGLARDGRLHPVQRAFFADEVPQCGYCTAGIIMSAVALLRETPAPSDQQIRESLAGNLCRCGTQARVIRAIRRAARETSP